MFIAVRLRVEFHPGGLWCVTCRFCQRCTTCIGRRRTLMSLRRSEDTPGGAHAIWSEILIAASYGLPYRTPRPSQKIVIHHLI